MNNRSLEVIFPALKFQSPDQLCAFLPGNFTQGLDNRLPSGDQLSGADPCGWEGNGAGGSRHRQHGSQWHTSQLRIQVHTEVLAPVFADSQPHSLSQITLSPLTGAALPPSQERLVHPPRARVAGSGVRTGPHAPHSLLPLPEPSYPVVLVRVCRALPRGRALTFSLQKTTPHCRANNHKP